MTVNTTLGYQRTSGDGVTTIFAVPFALVEAAQLIVELVNKTTGVVSTQILATHYTLAIAGDGQSASVTMLVAPPATHWVVRRRNARYVQPTHLLPHGRFPADMVELGLDRLTMDLQAIRDTGARGIRVNDSDPLLAALPPIDSIKSTYLYIDSNGNPTGVAGPSNVPVSPAMVPVVQAASIGAALAVLGLSSYFQTLMGVASAPGLHALIGATPRRQTVAFGPIDANGVPTFWPATASGNTLNFQNITASAPLVLSCAGGFGAGGELNRVAIVTANPSIAGLANGTHYVYAEIDAAGAVTYGTTTLAPTYQTAGTYSTTNGQHTFNIVEKVMKVGTGSAANQVWRVFLGRVVVAGGNITSTVPYAYNAQYTSPYTNTIPTSLTAVNHNHNLGVAPQSWRVNFRCITAEQGYAIGDVLLYSIQTWDFDGSIHRPAQMSINSETLHWVGATHIASTFSRSTFFTLTAANWAYQAVVDRGW